MGIRIYHGSCLCKRVRFEAEIDFDLGTTKCNCTSCWKRRWWSVKAAPEGFRPLAGAEELGGSVFRQGHGGFCRHCGVTPYNEVEAADWNDGAYVSINVAALDDLDPAVLVESPIQLCDGLNDDWWHAPAETRHL